MLKPLNYLIKYPSFSGASYTSQTIENSNSFHNNMVLLRPFCKPVLLWNIPPYQFFGTQYSWSTNSPEWPHWMSKPGIRTLPLTRAVKATMITLRWSRTWPCLSHSNIVVPMSSLSSFGIWSSHLLFQRSRSSWSSWSSILSCLPHTLKMAWLV